MCNWIDGLSLTRRGNAVRTTSAWTVQAGSWDHEIIIRHVTLDMLKKTSMWRCPVGNCKLKFRAQRYTGDGERKEWRIGWWLVKEAVGLGEIPWEECKVRAEELGPGLRSDTEWPDMNTLAGGIEDGPCKG